MGAGRGNGDFKNTQGGRQDKPYNGPRSPENDFRNKKGKSTLDDHVIRHRVGLNVKSTDILRQQETF